MKPVRGGKRNSSLSGEGGLEQPFMLYLNFPQQDRQSCPGDGLREGTRPEALAILPTWPCEGRKKTRISKVKWSHYPRANDPRPTPWEINQHGEQITFMGARCSLEEENVAGQNSCNIKRKVAASVLLFFFKAGLEKSKPSYLLVGRQRSVRREKAID